MSRKLMKDTAAVRKKVLAEVERVIEGATDRATERASERLQPMMKTMMEEEMKRAMKSPMRVMKQEMKLVMEPPMEPVKKQEMKPGNDRAKKKRAMESTFSTHDAPAERNVNQRTSPDHQIKKPEQIEFQLQFINNKLPDKIYTNDKIKDESDGSVEIKLINTISGKTIEEGPLSSMEIEIHALDGDFGSDGYENWTEQEFKDKIVRERKEKGPLLKGKLNITLTNGVATIQNLHFSDNSSWIKCKKFRLGASVLRSTSNMGQVRIKEAITEPFAVRDHRGRMYKKHDCPSLDDEVWHLKKITRKREFHTHLNDNNIHTIRDFKNMNKTNPIKLREILKGCSDLDWDVIVKHASFVADDESPVLHQGMQHANNHASSSHGHKGGYLIAKEISLASQPLATSTGYPVNAQWVQRNSDFHSLTNGVSGRNDGVFLCSPMTLSSQFNHGPHPHIPAAHASNACSNPVLGWEAGAYNSSTTSPLSHEYAGPNQASSQNNNGPYPHISGVHFSSYASVTDSCNSSATGLPHPQYTDPNQGMQNDCNLASLSQCISARSQENDSALTTQPLNMSTDFLSNQQLNSSRVYSSTSSSSNFMVDYSQYDNGLLEQKNDS
ncbi:hypothetical protein Ddye_026076 [Dipteronia dyeriana]|uniref:Calmodulin-binding protein n=1 Tax=Dipteronia dyeriana TaxID=168575 RepID=A0AAD9WP64_9ROSI|nr:hypothetical protein Ddye_026076 [Dipteronia dyeriana]